MHLYFSIGNGQPREPALCQLYRHTFVPYYTSRPVEWEWDECGGNECFVVHRVFAFCLDVCWHDFARNADIRRIPNRPPLSSITMFRRLTSFGDLARMDENADASQAIFEPPPENWRRPPGQPRTTWMKNIHDHLSSLDLGIQDR